MKNNLIKPYLNFLKIISDLTNLRIANSLLQRNLCVCELTAILKISQPRISQHLKTLKYLNLIEEKRNGKWIIYNLNKKNPQINLLLKILQPLQNAEIFIKDKTNLKKCLKKNLCPITIKGKAIMNFKF